MDSEAFLHDRLWFLTEGRGGKAEASTEMFSSSRSITVVLPWPSGPAVMKRAKAIF